MIVFLPKDTDGLTEFEQSLTPTSMQKWLGQLLPHLGSIVTLPVTLPRFKATRLFILNDILAEMGIRRAFDWTQADFSGMTDSREPRKRLHISAVIHKAYVDVNEEGTEAAASTAIPMPPPPPTGGRWQPPIFRADHPFLFVIRDNRSGSILFMGRVSYPQ